MFNTMVLVDGVEYTRDKAKRVVENQLKYKWSEARKQRFERACKLLEDYKKEISTTTIHQPIDEYPINVYADVFYKFEDYRTPPKDAVATIEYIVLAAQLTKKQRQIFDMFYRQGLTCKKIAKALGSSTANIYSALARIRELLGDEQFDDIYQRGIVEYVAHLAKIIECKDKTIHRLESKLEQSEAARNNIVEWTYCCEGEEIALNRASPIELLNLSVYAYNQLRRGKIDTIGDVLDYPDYFIRIRNFGKHSFAELVNRLAEIGIPFNGRYEK